MWREEGKGYGGPCGDSAKVSSCGTVAGRLPARGSAYRASASPHCLGPGVPHSERRQPDDDRMEHEAEGEVENGADHDGNRVGESAWYVDFKVKRPAKP